MIQLLIAFVGGIVTLVPVFFVSPRRRELHLVRDEGAILKELPEGKAKRLMEEAHAASAESYRRRVMGLDRVDVLRRRLFTTLPVVYVAVLLLTYAVMRRADIADWLGVSQGAVTIGLYVAGGFVSLPSGILVGRYRGAIKARDRQIEAQVEEFEAREAAREAARQMREAQAAVDRGLMQAEIILKNSGRKRPGDIRVNKDGRWVVGGPRATPESPGGVGRKDEPPVG